MNIQLTDYGVSLLSTGEVFEATTFQLGNQYNYVPLQTATAKASMLRPTPMRNSSVNVIVFLPFPPCGGAKKRDSGADCLHAASLVD